MGWFWESTSPSAASSSAVPAQAPVRQKPPPPPASSATDTADREIQKFWEMLEAEMGTGNAPQATPAPAPTPSSQPPNPTPSKPPSSSSWLPWPSSSTPSTPSTATASDPSTPAAGAAPRPRERSPQSLALSEASLPATMSCRDAFDYAWHCNSVGSQWNAVYRYGGVRSCTELWDDFWFCMRTRSYAPESRAAAIQARFREKEAAKYGAVGKPSSEDVWESRDAVAAPGTEFAAPFPAADVDDAAMQRAELERRMRIRRELGFDKGGSGE